MESPSTLNQAADFGKIEYLESMSIMDRAIAAVRNGKIPNVAYFFIIHLYIQWVGVKNQRIIRNRSSRSRTEAAMLLIMDLAS